ncbi:MAG: hypothetical protein NTV52_20415 [Acidobacteria bacterium]|nr:hypothetical protein [Acidobacteriota bacterium]
MIYPHYTGKRGPDSTLMPDPSGPLRPLTVEIETNKNLKGYGRAVHAKSGIDLKKNVALVKRTPELAGPDCAIMIDCWMALAEIYTIQLAEAIAPYRILKIEEVLPPDDYEGFGRLNQQIPSTALATGEHKYTCWGFRRLLNAKAVDI